MLLLSTKIQCNVSASQIIELEQKCLSVITNCSNINAKQIITTFSKNAFFKSETFWREQEREQETTEPFLNGWKVALIKNRYTWRHNNLN